MEPRPTPAPIHACTVDVEDYYQVSAFDDVRPRSSWAATPERVTASTSRVLDLLDAAGVRGTFFILGRVAERSPGIVRAVHEAGHEIGCHSDDHRLVYRMTPAEFRSDLVSAKRRIEDLLGTAVTAHRAPSFSITRASLWALDILAAEGFTHDSSIYPVVHDRYGMPGAPAAPFVVQTSSGPLVEFPPTSFRLFGRCWPGCGGGYLRLFPYWLTAWIIRRAESEGRPANLYVHPWEFDPDQPRMAGLSWRTRFRHYVGLRRTEPRMARLLREFSFGTMTEALVALPALPRYRVQEGEFVAATEEHVAVHSRTRLPLPSGSAR